MTSSKSSGRAETEVDPVVGEEISRRLKAMYREVESEAIPERFLDLLEQLDEAERSQKAGESE